MNDQAIEFPVIQYFKMLEQNAFISLEHSAYLKGLLKPFKGKRELSVCASQSEHLRDQLIILAQHNILSQAQCYPFSLLPIQLALQTTGAGTAFLRWRKVDRSAMGVHLWDELMMSSITPVHLIGDLYAMEVQRITFNMQVSLLHSIAKQAKESAGKVSHAQSVYQERLGK